MLTVVDRDSIVVTEQSRLEAGRVVDDLPDDAQAQLMVVAGARKPQPVPPELAQMLTRVLRAVARGGSVTIASLPDELTTTNAASELGISRPTLMKMIREGEIPAHMVGTHHRLKTADVREFRRKQLKQQRAAFESLLALEDELGVTE